MQTLNGGGVLGPLCYKLITMPSMLILHFLSEQSTSPYVTGGKENILVTQKKCIIY